PGRLPTVVGLNTPVTETEKREGLRTALPTQGAPLEVTLTGDAARVQLPKGFDELGVSEQILGVAQIVYTLTGTGGIDAVQFREGTSEVAVPNGSGRLVSGAAARADYAVVAPRE